MCIRDSVNTLRSLQHAHVLHARRDKTRREAIEARNKENRATLAKWPEIKKGADLMRSHAKQWFSTANALHDAYAANPTPENRDALATGLNVLSTAMSQATQYMAQAAQP